METKTFKLGSELTTNDTLITKGGRKMYIRQIRHNDMGTVVLIFSGGREAVIWADKKYRVA